MRLHTLLVNIQSQQLVNFDQVLKNLPSYVKWNEVFHVEKSDEKNKHIVEVINLPAFEMLLNQSALSNTRAEAAVSALSTSHAVQCDSAYMLCFPAPKSASLNSSLGVNTLRTLKVVASSQNNILPMPFSPAEQAIVIENQDCFFQWDRLLKHYQSELDATTSDIYFAGGNRILNKVLHPILNQYASIKCLFDYDLAGLEMSLHLQRHFENSSKTDIEFVVPHNIAELTRLFTFSPKSNAVLQNMLSLCAQNNLPSLANVIYTQKAFMEQEAMLTLDPK